MATASRRTTLPLLAVALAALAALIAAAWLVFAPPVPETVAEEPTMAVPGDPTPAPMPAPAPPATAP